MQAPNCAALLEEPLPPLGFEFYSREYRSWGTRTWDLFYFPFLKVVDFDCKPDLYILLRRVQSTASTACR